MTDHIPEQFPGDLVRLAEELKKQTEQLNALTKQLAAREAAFAEMVRNYPVYKRFVYDKMREYYEQTLPPIPDNVDIEELIRIEDGVPLESFIHLIEGTDGDPR